MDKTPQEIELCEYNKNVDVKWNESLGSIDRYSCIKQTDTSLRISRTADYQTY